MLRQRQRQLWRLEKETARLRAAAAQKRAEQEAALNAALDAKGDVAAQIEQNEAAFRQATSLVNRLVAEREALEEARRLAEEEARREARRNSKQLSAAGYRWPEIGARITQEWGPTSFALEPSYTYHGVYLPALPRRDRHDGRLRRADPGCQGRRGGGLGPAAVAVRPGLRRGDRPRRRHPDLVLAHHHPDHRVSPARWWARAR